MHRFTPEHLFLAAPGARCVQTENGLVAQKAETLLADDRAQGLVGKGQAPIPRTGIGEPAERLEDATEFRFAGTQVALGLLQ